MADRRLAKAHKAWTQALEEMRAALTANPLSADALMASAQVFEDIGTILFEAAEKPRPKRAKSTRAAPRRKSKR